ncbi:FecR family protein [Cloacibacterium sp.]|uniref:FecR family protein n=1 Tax=Cloacibacterium sp. TaxID=1913682 RepID=UPI0039E297D0
MKNLKNIEKDWLQIPINVKVSREVKQRIWYNIYTATIGKKRKFTYQVAAIILLMISLGGLFTYTTFYRPDVYIAESANRKVMLKDGSVVTLFPGAELTVTKSFPEDTRIVNLKGDALFFVAKDKLHPFIVKAENFSTKVLGTVFKISQSRKDKFVELYEGKVAVSYSGTKDSYLNPNQVWTNFGIVRTTAIYTKKIDKQSGKHINKIESLSFNEVPFGEIIETVKKYYNINILYPAEISTKKISAELKGNIDENVEALAFATGMEVQKANNTYILKK